MDDPGRAAEELLKKTGLSAVLEMHRGRDIHYEKTLDLLAGELKALFLLQRSSTLVLGPAFDSSNEFILATRLYSLVRETKADFFHLVSLEGIAERLRGAAGSHPKLDVALGNLVRVPSEEGELVGVAGGGGRSWVLKHLDRPGDVENQVRFLLVERADGSGGGVMVFRFGGEDFSFLIEGPAAGRLLAVGRGLYERSPAVTWAALGEVLRASVPAELFVEKAAAFF